MIIEVHIPDKPEEESWVIPFNEIALADEQANIFMYIRNTGESPIELESLSISCNHKASSIQIHSVLGEAEFTREVAITPVNKNTWRNGTFPEVEVYACSRCTELYSQGQLDRLEMPTENTTYRTECDITIGPDSIIAISASTIGRLSGIITISQKLED